jgi:hypothetical protein
MSASLAASIVWAILGSIDSTGRHTGMNKLGLAAGIAASLGLGAFRFGSATGTAEIIVTFGLTLLEVALVLLTEWVAAGLRQHIREWTSHQVDRARAQSHLTAAIAEHSRRMHILDLLNDKVDRHILFVEDLTLRNASLEQLIDIAVKATIDGYYDGIASNRGLVG